MIYFDIAAGLIGDAISAVPYMLHRQALSGEIATVGPDFNAWVWHGLDVAGRLQLGIDAPQGSHAVKVHPQLTWHHCNAHGWPWHMSEGHFRQAGMEPVNAFKVPFKQSELDLGADYIIAPFSTTDHNFNKRWPDQYWQEIIRKLPSNVWVIGSRSDDMRPFTEAGANALAGATLPRIVSLLRKCKCLISIDTGIGHLGTMLNMHNHVMIYSREVPAKFAEAPFGRTIIGNHTRDILPDSVNEAVQDVRAYALS